MESIQSGNGLQYARLNLDWSTLKQVTGTDSDKTKLNAAIKKANSLLETLQEEDYGYSSENIEMLKAVIAAGEEISDNLNVDQTAVDSATDSLNAAMSVFNKEAVKVDKSELKKAIEAADSYLNNGDGGTFILRQKVHCLHHPVAVGGIALAGTGSIYDC